MELKEIVNALPRKAVKRIAEKACVSHSLVSLVLSGKRENDVVLEAAISLIEEEKQRKIEMSDRLKKALS